MHTQDTLEKKKKTKYKKQQQQKQSEIKHSEARREKKGVGGGDCHLATSMYALHAA